MKIDSVRIQKFRSIDDVTVSFGQVLAIVGANNAGKSHVLRALNAFFNYQDEHTYFEHYDHAFSLKSRPKITVVFSDIKESDEIPQSYMNIYSHVLPSVAKEAAQKIGALVYEAG